MIWIVIFAISLAFTTILAAIWEEAFLTLLFGVITMALLLATNNPDPTSPLGSAQLTDGHWIIENGPNMAQDVQWATELRWEMDEHQKTLKQVQNEN